MMILPARLAPFIENNVVLDVAAPSVGEPILLPSCSKTMGFAVVKALDQLIMQDVTVPVPIVNRPILSVLPAFMVAPDPHPAPIVGVPGCGTTKE